MVVGIIATSAYQSERILVMKPGETGRDRGIRAQLPRRDAGQGAELHGAFRRVRRDARRRSAVTRLEPEKRIYDAPPQPTTEAGIHNSWRGDLYVVLGDQQANGGYAVQALLPPFVRFIWIGALIMFIGGGVSISDRRLRVGAPTRARRAPPSAVPAE